MYGLGAKAMGASDSNALSVAFLAPLAENTFGFTLEGILNNIAVGMELGRRERERQARLGTIQGILQSLGLQNLSTGAQAPQPVPSIQPNKPLLTAPLDQKGIEIEEDSRWREVVVHPSIVLVLGKRGSGKSALGYRLLELFRHRLTPFVLGLPRQGRKLLPEWIGMAQSLEDVPQKSIVLVDESYLRYSSRDSLTSNSRDMSRLLNLSRQRGQTIIFVSQEARQIDKNIASSANVLTFRDLGILQIGFDRPELRKIAGDAKGAFAAIPGDRRSFSYVYSPDTNFMGLLNNSLPSFWSNKLSEIFAAGEGASPAKPPKRMTLEERKQKARELRQQGFSFGQIAQTYSVTKGTAYNWVNGYPYKRLSDRFRH
jgi:hypothetical protein